MFTDQSPAATQQVAFTAHASSQRSYSSGSLIQFDDVESNVGNHFDNSTTFTCPVDGLYFFYFSIMTDTAGDIIVGLEIDNRNVVSLWAETYRDNDYPHSSNSAVVGCTAGQEVNLVCDSSGDVYSTFRKYSTFSGFLISAN